MLFLLFIPGVAKYLSSTDNIRDGRQGDNIEKKKAIGSESNQRNMGFTFTLRSILKVILVKTMSSTVATYLNFKIDYLIKDKGLLNEYRLPKVLVIVVPVTCNNTNNVYNRYILISMNTF